MRLIVLNFIFLCHILDDVGASVLVRPQYAVLGPDDVKVVRPRVAGESQCLPRAAFADAGSNTPSRQPQPFRICG